MVILGIAYNTLNDKKKDASLIVGTGIAILCVTKTLDGASYEQSDDT